MRFPRSYGLFLLAGLLTSAVPSAHAKPGEHIRFGNTTVTPSIRLGFEVLSNAFRAQSDPQLGGNLNLTPALTAVYDTPDATLSFNAAYKAQKFLFLTDPQGFGSERVGSQVKSLDRFNSFNAGLSAAAFRTRSFGLHISDRIVLQNNPNDGDVESANPYVSQFQNTLAGGVDIRPGPALEFQVNGTWGWTQFFLPDAQSPRQPFNTRNAYGSNLQVKWLFLQRTAWVLSASYQYNNWKNEEVRDFNGIESDFRTPDSNIIQVSTGLQGRVTNRLKLIAKVGYGGAIIKGGGEGTTAAGGILGVLQGTYEVTDDHNLMLGYRKTFFDSYFTNVNQVNALYAGWNGKYGKKLTSTLKYSLRFENFRGDIDRNDYVNQLQAGIGIDATAWLNIGLNGSWLQRRSSDIEVEYDDFRGGLGITAQY